MLTESLWQDFRYGVRMFMKQPGFTFIAVLILALGIGANTTIFSAIESVILHPFSFPNLHRLVVIYERQLSAGVKRSFVSPGTLHDWREQSQTFEQIVSMIRDDFNLTGTDKPERLGGYRVSAGFFTALGAQPLLGRVFQSGDDTEGREQIVVLKHSLWGRRYGSDPNILGQSIKLNGKAYTVIGVMPEDFNFPYNDGEFWIPFVFPAQLALDRESRQFIVIGLLKPGVSLGQGDAEIRALSLRSQQQYPDTNSGIDAFAADLNKEYTRNSRIYLPFTLGAVAFVLLIACANVANLLLARGSARRKELAVRMALGANRLRVMRQLLTESLLLALLGGALGIGFSVLGINTLANGLPQDYAKFIPGWEHLGINARALGFTMLVSLLTGILCGLLPAWQATKADFNETLKEGGKGVARGASNRWRSLLVVAEMALSLMLLAGAGLMIRSFIIILNTDFGFDPDNNMTMRLVLPEDNYQQPEQRVNFYRELERRMTALPGVTAVGAVDVLPFGEPPAYYFQIVGRPSVSRSAHKSAQPRVDARVATPGYFTAVGTPLRAGRLFTAQDDANAPRVALVNEAFARRYFADDSAIGQRLSLNDGPPTEIVGVVANVLNASNVMNTNLDEPTIPGVYQPLAQHASRRMALVVRGQMNQPGQENVIQMVGAIRRELAALDANLPLSNIKLMREIVREFSAPKRIIATMLGIFAMLALIMAMSGLYAVMSFAVSQRTNEIGIRMALGAQKRDVYMIVVKQGLHLIGLGIVIGLVGAFAMTRLLSKILYGVTASDLITYIIVAGLLFATALVACFVPAQRATQIDPLIALRSE